MPTATRVIGIDAGGSSTRARALINGQPSPVGIGGPANALTPDVRVLEAGFESALDGLPDVDAIAVCAAGAGSPDARDRVADVLHHLRPGTAIGVYPDYAAAFFALPAGTDICVIAGTGSVVCSPVDSPTGWLVSGGRGWILGDHGSASALGRAFLKEYVKDRREWPDWVTSQVAVTYGDADWRGVVQRVHTSKTPATLLAAAAPILTRLAAERDPGALAIVDRQFGHLAQTTLEHARRLDKPIARVGLVGGVWRSAQAVASFDTHLRRAGDSVRLSATGPVDPLGGALVLATRLEEGLT